MKIQCTPWLLVHVFIKFIEIVLILGRFNSHCPRLSIPSRVNAWGQKTLDHYLGLYFSPEAPQSGVILTSAYQLWKDPIPDPEWSSVVPHFRHLTAKELALYDRSGTHSHGWFYQTVIT